MTAVTAQEDFCIILMAFHDFELSRLVITENLLLIAKEELNMIEGFIFFSTKGTIRS